MAVERTYNVPLRREWLKAPKYRRAEKAVMALRRFLIRHMKSENISLGQHLNELVWQHGMRNPPHHVKVNVLKEDDGKVFAELVGFEVKKKEEVKEEKKAEKKPEEKKEEAKKEIKVSEEKIKEELKKLEEKTEKIKKEKEAEGKKEEKVIENLEAKREKAEKKKEGKPKGEYMQGRNVQFEEKRKKEKVAHH